MSWDPRGFCPLAGPGQSPGLASLPVKAPSRDPSARIAAAIELLAAIDAAPRKPADAVANDFFRDRRFIGSGDRRAVSDRAWQVLRTRRRLAWWLERAGARGTPRLLVAASLMLDGWSLSGVMQSFSGRPVRADAGESGGAGGAGRHRGAHARASGHARGGAAGGARLDPAAAAGAVRRRSGGRDGGDGSAGAARPAGEPAEGDAGRGAGGAGGGGDRGRADAALALGPARRRATPGHPPARRSRAGWWRSRTRAASWSRRWSAPRRTCGSPTGAPGRAARRWPWR